MHKVQLRFSLNVYLVVLLICVLPGRCESSKKKLFPKTASQEKLRIAEEIPRAKIARWYNNCAAAISLTYDAGNPMTPFNQKISHFVINNGLTMDYEIVTQYYRFYPHLKKFLLEEMIPSGLGYFGHGDKHIDHDGLSYEEALASFKKCYQAMLALGLKPAAYAYPNGKGHKMETRKALAEAGFLCGRLHYSKQMTAPYIVPGGQLEPEDWFALPTLVMQDYDFSHCKDCVGSNEELIPYLDETIRRGAWVILTYHAIGKKKKYGFFKYEEFEKDIYSIKERNFWNASMNAITLYIRERLHAEVKIVPLYDRHKEIKEIRITVADGLPNDIYDQPLTLLLELPGSWGNTTVGLVEKKKILNTYTVTAGKGIISLKPDEIERKIVKLKTSAGR